MLLLSFVVAGVSPADEAAQTFDQANQLYLQAKYPDAITQYREDHRERMGKRRTVFQPGKCVLQEREHPESNSELRTRGATAPPRRGCAVQHPARQSSSSGQIEAVPRLFIYRWIDWMLSLFSLATMGWIVYSFFVLTLAAFAVFLFARTYTQKRLSMFAGLLFSAALILTMIGFGVQSYTEAIPNLRSS